MGENVKAKVKALLVIAVIVIAGVAVSGGKFPGLSEIGFLTGTQGLEPQFHSLYFNNSWCSATEKPSWAKEASSWSFGYTLDFDPDVKDEGWCDLLASQQPVTVDTQVEPKHYIWSVDEGKVTLQNGTKAKKITQFEVWRYRATWSVNIWLGGPEGETCDTTYLNIITWEPNYAGSKLWIKLVPKTFVYFKENPEQLFIAPAYIGLDSYQWIGIDKNGQKILDDPDIAKSQDLIPKARGETLGIYYERGGTPIDLEGKLLTYQGLQLDPQIFRNQYWTRIDFVTFKPINWYDWQIWHNWKYPSINLQLVVYLFVVGKWTVYLTSEEVPQLQGHTPTVQLGNPIANFFEALGAWFQANQGWILFIIIVIVILLVTVFNPGLWAVLASRRSKSGG